MEAVGAKDCFAVQQNLKCKELLKELDEIEDEDGKNAGNYT